MLEKFSEEWNLTCANRPYWEHSLRDDTKIAQSYFIFGWFLMAAFAFYILTTTFAFWFLRKNSPRLQKRNLSLLLLGVLGAFLVGYHGIIRDSVGVHSFPCDIMIWMKGIGVALLLGPIGLRLLLFRNQLMMAKKIGNLSKNEFGILQDSKRKELESARFRTSTGFILLVLMVGVVLPYVIMCLIFQFGVSYYNHGCTGCMDGTLELAMISLIGVSQQIIFIAQSHHLRFEKDPLGLLFEIKASCLSSLWIGGIAVFLDFLDPAIGRPYDYGIYNPDWFVLFAMFSLHFFLCPYQIYLSFSEKNRQDSGKVEDGRRKSLLRKSMARIANSAGGIRLSLGEVLSNPDTKRMFHDHLITEFATENIVFHNSIENFRRGFDTLTNRDAIAKDILETFIKQDSVMQVNLPASLREEIEHHLEDKSAVLDPTVFDAAQEEIMSLMTRDSLPRFLKSAAYVSHCEGLKKTLISGNPMLDNSS